MKNLINIIFLLTTLFVNSQSLEKLDSVSASNIYVSTNKKQVLTKYETYPEPIYVLYYGNGNVSNLINYDFIVFNDKNEVLIFLNITERSIVKSKMIIYHMGKENFVIKGVTSHTAELNVNKYDFYLNDKSIEDIKKQLTD